VRRVPSDENVHLSSLIFWQCPRNILRVLAAPLSSQRAAFSDKFSNVRRVPSDESRYIFAMSKEYFKLEIMICGNAFMLHA